MGLPPWSGCQTDRRMELVLYLKRVTGLEPATFSLGS